MDDVGLVERFPEVVYGVMSRISGKTSLVEFLVAY
jgi:hypothetical protein